MKKALMIIGIVLGSLLLIGVIGFVLITISANNAVAALTYDSIDMSRAADGTFEGTAEAGLASVTVSVTVKANAISRIDILEHNNGRGAAAEAITQAMTAANTYDVDVVSGATISSQTIKSAVSHALKAACAE